MTDYFYDMDLVVDPLNPANVVANGQVSIYDPADTTGATLLALKDPSGLPLPNPLTSNANGFLPPRIAQVPQTMWKSGGFTGYFNSYKGLRDEAVGAKTAAQTAANSAASAANEVVTTAAVDGSGALVLTKASGATVNAGQVKGATGAQGPKGDKGLDGSNVLPTDDAIEQAIKTAGTKTATALSATYVPKWKPNTAYLAGDKVLSPNGDVVSAKANFTSAAAYSTANWDQSATLAGKIDKTEAVSTFALPHSNTAVLFGTSLENQNNSGPDALDPVDANAVNSRGWFTWANGYLGQRFKLLYNAGIGGNTSAQMLARIQTDVLAYNPDWVFMGGPANDPSSDIDPAVTIANYTAILDALGGRQVVMLNHPPRIEINTTSRRAAVAKINEWIRLLPQTRKNVIVIDVWRLLADPATGAPATGMAVDGTHYTEAGAHRVGARVATVVAPLSIPRPRRVLGVLDPNNCIGNPSFTGGTGWSNLGTSGATPTYVADTETWATKAVIDITGVTDEAERGIRYLENISSGRFAAGDIIQATARFTWTNLVPITAAKFCRPFLRCMTRKTDGTYARQDILGFFIPSPVYAVPAGVPASGDMVVSTFRFTMPAGVDRLYVDLGWQGAASMHLEVSDLAVSKGA